jgi:hypothetical protein
LEASRISAGAVIRISEPAFFCNSAIAIIIATLAFARACDCADPCADDLKDKDESPSRPTAKMVNRIIKASVATRAKPLWLPTFPEVTPLNGW